MEPCSFGRRIAAFAIDQVIAVGTVFFVFSIVVAMAGIDLEEEPSPGSRDEQVLQALVMISVVAPFAYFWIWNSVGFSPGKQMLGLRIVDERGQPPGLARGFARTVGTLLTVVLAIPYLALAAAIGTNLALLFLAPLLLPSAIPYLWAIWDQSENRPLARGRRQAWHDKVAGTRIVRG